MHIHRWLGAEVILGAGFLTRTLKKTNNVISRPFMVHWKSETKK